MTTVTCQYLVLFLLTPCCTEPAVITVSAGIMMVDVKLCMHATCRTCCNKTFVCIKAWELFIFYLGSGGKSYEADEQSQNE